MINLASAQRFVRRVQELGWPKSLPKRYAIFSGILFTLFIYYLFYSNSSITITALHKCVADEFLRKSYDIFDPLNINESVSFIGNGFIGLEAAVNKQLLINLQNSAKISPIFTRFWPLVEVNTLSSLPKNQHYVSDFEEGMTKSVQCFMELDKCVCTYQLIYAHRTRPNLLVQEIRISNPSTSTFELNFYRPPPKEWEKHESESTPVFVKIFDEGTRSIMAIKCSTPPIYHPIVIKAQTEETYRFLCVVEQEALLAHEKEMVAKRRLTVKVANNFSLLNSISSNLLDNEHRKAWKTLNKALFNISHSKAPNVLNSRKINLMRYALLSSVKSPLLELEQFQNKRQYYENSLSKTELCYSGHSTLLTPSKLWQDYKNIQELLKTVEIWLKTLEQHGCVHVLQAGAHGVAQAFLLSLIAATFTHHRLEIALDPEEDLHRHIRVENLRLGTNGLLLTLDFNIDSQLKPYVTLSSYGGGANTFLYACSAGCLEAPKSIGSVPAELAIKVTKPITPILFLAEDKSQLQQLKETLHVIEVLDAPAHESEKIALHQHGENKGLPTIFWVILISLIIAFHLFFVKLLYTEWKNSNLIPYSKYSKKLLLKR